MSKTTLARLTRGDICTILHGRIWVTFAQAGPLRSPRSRVLERCDARASHAVPDQVLELLELNALRLGGQQLLRDRQPAGERPLFQRPLLRGDAIQKGHQLLRRDQSAHANVQNLERLGREAVELDRAAHRVDDEDVAREQWDAVDEPVVSENCVAEEARGVDAPQKLRLQASAITLTTRRSRFLNE